MHEMSIATSLIQSALSHIPDDQFLSSIYITFGPLSGVCEESLLFCFSIVAGEYGHAHAQLIINSVPARFRCSECDTHYETDDFYDGCPICKSIKRIVLSGDQFTLDAIDVEEKSNV